MIHGPLEKHIQQAKNGHLDHLIDVIQIHEQKQYMFNTEILYEILE